MSADGNPASRWRSFIATRQDKRIKIGGSSKMETASDDDDLPVLTEIVHVTEEVLSPLASTETSHVSPETPRQTETRPLPVSDLDLEEIAKRMGEAIDQQMTYELPTLIEASLLSIVAELRSGIASTVDAALRDFITAQKETRSGDKH